MLCTRMAWSCLGALAVATWLATPHAQAQDDYHLVAADEPSESTEELPDLRSELSEMRSQMKASTSNGYEQGPSYGGAPSCGCAPTCGCAPSCGCEQSCGCGECCGCGCCDCCGTWGGFEPCCHS